jgi:HPt (histidine-containing phosphotransfer) domain-containing protein
MSIKPDVSCRLALPAVAICDLLIWDFTTLGRLFGDDQPMQERMLCLFVHDAGLQVAAIGLATAAGEFAAAAELAHMLKTSARLVGALRMGELCEQIEGAGSCGKGPACSALAAGLEAAFCSARSQMNQATPAAVP